MLLISVLVDQWIWLGTEATDRSDGHCSNWPRSTNSSRLPGKVVYKGRWTESVQRMWGVTDHKVDIVDWWQTVSVCSNSILRMLGCWLIFGLDWLGDKMAVLRDSYTLGSSLYYISMLWFTKLFPIRQAHQRYWHIYTHPPLTHTRKCRQLRSSSSHLVFVPRVETNISTWVLSQLLYQIFGIHSLLVVCQ